MTDAERWEHNRRQTEAFDRLAGAFDQTLPPDIMRRLERLVAAASPRPGETVLDVGTGTGVLLPLILAFDPSRVEACDLSGEMLRRARTRFDDRVTFHQRDVTDLLGQVAPVDIIYCNACFGNFYDQGAALATMAQLLRPGGRLAMTHPMGRAFVQRLHEEDPALVPHLLPDPEAGSALLAGAGLEPLIAMDEPQLYILLGRRPL